MAATLSFFELVRGIHNNMGAGHDFKSSLSANPPSPLAMDSAGRFDHLAPRNPNTAAIERAAQSRNPRAVTAAGKKTRVSKNHEFEPWDTDHPIRQEFRRLLDPGILRNNDKKDAAESLRVRNPADDCDNDRFTTLGLTIRLQVLNKITENILKNPDVPKYRKLDPTKRMMNLHIMSKKGTVEFLQRVRSFRAVFRRLTNTLWTKMGFREKVRADRSLL